MHCLLFIDQTLSGIWNLLIGILTWSIVPCAVWLVILAVIIVKKPELDISILTAQLKITWKMLAGMGKLLWNFDGNPACCRSFCFDKTIFKIVERNENTSGA